MDLLNNIEFKKDKYLYSLVSHNLEYEKKKIIAKENYIFVVGRDEKAIWIWTNDDINRKELDNLICDLDSIINLYAKKKYIII